MKQIVSVIWSICSSIDDGSIQQHMEHAVIQVEKIGEDVIVFRSRHFGNILDNGVHFSRK